MKKSLVFFFSVLLTSSFVACKGEKRNTLQDGSKTVSIAEKPMALVEDGEPVVFEDLPFFGEYFEETGDDGKDVVKDENTVYPVAEEMPQFPGGVDSLLAYIQKNQQCPKEMREKGLKGRVVTQFVVEKDGSLSDVRVLRSIASSFSANGYDSEYVKPIIPLVDEEAVRLIKAMPKWEPGRMNEERVRVKYTLPIRFPCEPLVKK